MPNVHLFHTYLCLGTDHQGVVPGRSCDQSGL